MQAGQTDNAPSLRVRPRWSVAAATALVVMVTIVPAAGAAASTGSIPPDVIDFAQADDGLVRELEEYFGADQRGGGLDFSEGIEPGEIDRIFLWSEAYQSGQSTETPVQYVNRWKVPVLIAEEPIGIAMIGIDPATVEPEMIDFIRSPGTALALDDVDKDATLVHEPETGAWFSLSDGAVIPLVRGDSGVSGETTLIQYQSMLASRVVDIVEPTPQPDQGSVQSVVLIATTAGVLLLALLIPMIMGQVRQHREREAEADSAVAGSEKTDADEGLDFDGDVSATSVEPAPVISPEPTLTATVSEKVPPKKRATTSSTKAAMQKTTPVTQKTAAKKSSTKLAPSPTTTKKPSTKSPASSKSAVKTPAASKPAAARTAATPPSATKAGTKPVAKKPATKKPATKKPATKKPATKKPATKKPSASEHSGD